MGARPGEDDLIGRHFAPMAGPAGLGLQDDAALYGPPPGTELVLTVDASVAGVHFLARDPPDAIGYRALAVNLSDLAAKGADPAGFLLALALPDDWTEDWLTAFAGGLARLAAASGCPLLGGDTVRAAGPLAISITAFGTVPAGRMVRRTTARPGDLVCVTGTIGDATLGLALASGEDPGWAKALSPAQRDHLVARFRYPAPRLDLREALREHASAAMDVSDGLAGDLAKMLRASGVCGTLDLDRIPLSPAARAALAQDPTLIDRIASGGDDYEILLTLPPARLAALRRDAAGSDLALTVLGEVKEGPPTLSVLSEGVPRRLVSGSFQHFDDA